MNGDSWAEYFHLNLADGDRREAARARDRLFPICAVCLQTCGEIWA